MAAMLNAQGNSNLKIIPADALRKQDIAGCVRGRIYASIRQLGPEKSVLLHHELNTKYIYDERASPFVNLGELYYVYEIFHGYKGFVRGPFRGVLLSTSGTGKKMDGCIEWELMQPEKGRCALYVSAIATSGSPSAAQHFIFKKLMVELDRVALLFGARSISLHSETMRPKPLSRFGFFELRQELLPQAERRPYFIKALPPAEQII